MKNEIGHEIIKFDFLGLHLQEPMAIAMNLLISLFCFYAFFRLKKWNDKANIYWQRFYLTFGISTFFGAMGHAFYEYFGVVGKYPCWILGCVANCYAAIGMLRFKGYTKPQPLSVFLIILKSFVLLVLAIVTSKFIFVAIDAILTYIIYTGVFGVILIKRGAIGLKWIVLGVLVLIPSAFIFIFKVNIHRWLNKDDLSHVLMLACIYFFYIGMKTWGKHISIPRNV